MLRAKRIKITANKPVMDKVVQVWFGERQAHSNNILVEDGKKHLWVGVLQGEKDKIPASGTEVLIVLHFDPEAKVTSSNIYKFSKPFRYK